VLANAFAKAVVTEAVAGIVGGVAANNVATDNVADIVAGVVVGDTRVAVVAV
jgi:hypothetical protein